MKLRIISVFIVVVICFLFFLGYNSEFVTGKPDLEFNFEKILNREDIPPKILDNINQLHTNGELEYGVWGFDPLYFETDFIYVMFCGGSIYPDTYDVKIIDTFFYVVSGATNRRGIHGAEPSKNDRIEKLRYRLVIEEYGTDASVNYARDYDFPILLFKANKRYSSKAEWISSVSVIDETGKRSFSAKKNFPPPNEPK